ncbi:MAG: oxidoreductase FAD/NAD(P)-binding domain protein [Thermoleophilia bacterium]|nr:oxidoreductase FAD/NAD(P)-binding domain protein [Thermoleophilia bacterium]
MERASASSSRARSHAASRLAWQLWVSIYVFTLLSPLALLVLAPARGGDRLDLFALYAGYLGFTGFALQLVLPSRLPGVSETFGIPLLLRVHRALGSMVLAFVVLHVAIFAWHHPKYRDWLLWPFDDAPRAQLGWLAVVALLALLVTTWGRRRFRLSYEHWRFLHLALGLLCTSAALGHVLVISWYSAYAPLRWLLLGIFALGIGSVAYLRVLRPYGRLAAPYHVRAVVPERGAATSLLLEAAGHDGIRFQPGQFAWIKVKGGTYSLQEHPFSFSSSAADPRRPSFTIKALGDFSSGVESIQVGTEVLIDGPHGSWMPPVPDAGYVLIVAGIGITPAMSIIRTLADHADGRPVRLLYGARTWDDITFREEIDALALRPDLALEPWYVLDTPPEGWTGWSGRMDAKLMPQLLPPDAGARNYFICGPPMMIDGVLATLNGLGIPDDLVYADRF